MRKWVNILYNSEKFFFCTVTWYLSHFLETAKILSIIHWQTSPVRKISIIHDWRNYWFTVSVLFCRKTSQVMIKLMRVLPINVSLLLKCRVTFDTLKRRRFFSNIPNSCSNSSVICILLCGFSTNLLML